MTSLVLRTRHREILQSERSSQRCWRPLIIYPQLGDLGGNPLVAAGAYD